MDLGVSKNRGTPKSSILIGFSVIFTIHFGIQFVLGDVVFLMRRAHLLRKCWSLFSEIDLKNLPDFEDSGLQFRKQNIHHTWGPNRFPQDFDPFRAAFPIYHPMISPNIQNPAKYRVRRSFGTLKKKNLPQEMLRGSFAPTHKVLGCVGYGIFTYIWLNCMVNVGKYTIHRMLLRASLCSKILATKDCEFSGQLY